MPHTRIKICGITRPEDAALASLFGADALGLNFVGGPRCITFSAAGEILAELPPFLTIVALLGDVDPAPRTDGDFLTPSPELDSPEKTAGASDVLNYTHYLQLYAPPSKMQRRLQSFDAVHFIRRNNFFPVLHIHSRQSIADLSATLTRLQLHPAALLLDTASPTKLGGTGQPFNWHWIAEARAAGELENLPPLILAGGLNPDNVAEAIRIAQPYAVDVSSGVEFPNQPGIKDPARLKAFIQAVRATS